MLGNILVLDLADEQGSFCSKLLADLGAAVIRLDRAGEDGRRRQSPNDFLYCNSNKTSYPVDLKTGAGRQFLQNWIQQADVLVETFAASDPEFVAVRPGRLWRLNPRLVHISITSFGRAGVPQNPSETDGLESNPHPPGCRLEYTASLFGAVAALILLRKREITGRGSYFDLSIHEAAASMLERELTEYLNRGDELQSDSRSIRDRFWMLPASDGYVQVPILRNWETLSELIAARSRQGNLLSPEWRKPAREEGHIAQIVSAVEDWTRRRTRRELFELGQAMGFPWASVDTVEEAHENPQLKARRFFLNTPSSQGSPAVACPGLPYKFSAYMPSQGKRLPDSDEGALNIQATAPGRRRACPDERILKGVRIVDLTRMIAGPYATRILGDFGAEVIKIQPESTAAGAEQNNSYPFGVWNRNKKSVTLDLNRPESKALFLELVARSDVVVENFSPRVMGNWGLDYTRLKRVKPDLVMASISAMGQTGPWRDFVGFAPTFHALSGLISETFGSRRPPDDIEYPYADLLTGLYGALAILAALKFRDRTGEGQHVDLSALEAMCTILGPSFAERPTKPDITVEEQSRIQLNGWIEDARLAARRFFVSVHHPVLGEVVSCRTALWNWRRKPRWKSSPRLGDTNKKIRNSQIEFL